MTPTLACPDLPGWLDRQRWFAGSTRTLASADVVDIADVGGAWLALVEVAWAEGGTDRWQLALGPVAADHPAVLGTVDGTPVADVAHHPTVARRLLEAARRGATVPTAAGSTLRARPVGPAPSPAEGERTMGVEQSNTSVVVGATSVVKVVRHVEPGPSPEITVTEALTSAGFAGTPRLQGVVLGSRESALVVVSAFVPGSVGAWELAVEEAAGKADHGVADAMEDLGHLTATLHALLFTSLPTASADRAAAAATRSRIRRDLDVTRPVLAQAGLDPDEVDAHVEAVLTAAGDDQGALQQVHGDFHLGQVIRAGDGRWQILDFEGEPARAPEERTRPDNRLRDVAGLLRSLAYAEATAVRQGGDPAAAAAWRSRAEVAFRRGYGPLDEAWLDVFVLDKILYEVRYEAANRPDWVDIPLAPLRRIGSPMSDEPTSDDRPIPVPPSAPPVAAPDPDAVQALRDGRLSDPHRLLGRHPAGDRWVVRAWRPGASAVSVVGVDGEPVAAEEVVDGLFQAVLDTEPDPVTYRWRLTYPDGNTFDLVDPYAFPPTIGEVDQHLLAEGRHEQAWEVMGANRRRMHGPGGGRGQGINGVAFAVWAPNAASVRLVGSFNSWDGRLNPMRSMGSSGIWELFLPDVPEGAHYKYEMVTADGTLALRADPWARWTEVPPGTASRVFTSSYDQTAPRPGGDHLHGPVSIYEVHAGSWRHKDGRALTYRELAHQLADHVTELGFTHVELLPVAEHPFGGSWGYQVTGHFAPTSRFGTPDDFRYLVDHLHQRGLGVIVDWVPAHFPKDEWALARFDGTALYEHADPRQGEHPDWGTLVFNYGRTEVRNYLLASALFWLEELGVDGLRVDAVASMLYLDYSREEGEWVPNEHGGRENLRAVELLQEVNATAYKRNPGIMTVAEESTAWPGVSRPTHLGGLGFGFKWNMGWMHDTLSYFARSPVYRRYHHDQLTFGLMYAWSEHFVLPLSHDEVVHGKGSLLGKMPGDAWQQFANLRALYGWMWGHPGKQLLFMGGEFGQGREWSEERELDWHLLGDPQHAGVQAMVRDANHAYRSLPALWRRDDDPESFRWIDANNADDNLLSFLRFGEEGDATVAVIANLSPVPHHDLRVGLPTAGTWHEVLNTDAEAYGGGNVGNMGAVEATEEPWHGLPCSALVTAPPLGVVWLASG